ncbi:MAG: HD domain-containing protein [Lachnospiraceae bacterium]|nr:HD domain-containing protein [Lachnospiraceae bacterium]
MGDDRLKIVKYINDPVYGGIAITQMELEIIDTPIFQRLRGLRQLARVNFVFPGAEHSRYVHSLGVLYIMGLMTDHLLKKGMLEEEDAVKMRAAALLHDIGHYPLSHLGESVYSYRKDNKIADSIIELGEQSEKKHLYEMSSSHSNSAHHERLGKYIVVNNRLISRILKKNGLDPDEIGSIFTGELGSRNMVYTQLLHSSLDADRLDYLLRDSYQTGVKYGLVDLQYLVRLLVVVEDPGLPKRNNKVLACIKKGQHVVEHFLMSRYFHYSQVIFHKTNAAFEGMVKCMYIKLVQSGGFLYDSLEKIQDSVNEEDFLKFNDSFLEVCLKEYYDKTEDEEYKRLYEMYRDRIRPKVIFEMKDLYEESPSSEFSVLKWELKKNPDTITQIIGSDRWGYQIVPIEIEKIHNSYKVSEKNADSEALREAVKLYDTDSGEISYLAGDRLSIVSKLANYRSEFIRIYVLEEKGKKYDFKKMHQDIKSLITS